jgi:ATP-binding cassette, subfamily B, multidrug efflux pump
MNEYYEEETKKAALFNSAVMHLLSGYVFRYRKYLAISFFFVAIITVATLTVPNICRFMIDRYIVKEGSLAVFGGGRLDPVSDAAAIRAVKSGIRLSDNAYFVPRAGFSHLSYREKKRLYSENVVSDVKYTLVEKVHVAPELSLKLSNTPGIIGFPDNTYLLDGKALHGFTVYELVKIRAWDIKHIVLYSLLVLLIFCVQFVASYIQIISLMKLSQYAMRDLRRDLFSHILSLKLSFFDGNPVGRLVNRVTNDIEVLNELFSSVLVTLIQDMLICAGILVIMFIADVKLTLVVIASFPAIAVITLVFRYRARSAYRVIRTKIAALNAFLNEHISGIRIVRLFARENHQIAAFSEINVEAFRANMKQVYVYGVFRPFIEFFRWLSIAGVIYLGATLIASDRLSYGVLVMFLGYIGTFFEPLADLAEKFDTLQSATASGEKIMALFSVKPEDNAKIVMKGRNIRGKYACDIRFNDVWFAYKPDQWILKGLSFSIHGNSSLAIVGETGSGKTTISSLITKFYPVEKGLVTIGGIDINTIPNEVLRQGIASVMQDVFLFSRTVRENITLGKEFDRNAFDRAVEMSHCDSFIKSLPHGEDEPVMERGATFSTGQRQLLAIARALYLDPSILIMDEATSNIDTETERLIQDAISYAVKGRTSLIIAHRLSTVRNADNIMVIDKGVISEYGSHDALMAAKGKYFDLYNMQFEAV